VFSAFFGARMSVTPPPDTSDDNAFIVARSGDMSRSYCPTCQPNLDPLTGIWIVCYCADHSPSVSGSADRLALAHTSSIPLIGASDAEGDINRVWCDLIHRSKETPRE
jgi:hypothetical protein